MVLEMPAQTSNYVPYTRNLCHRNDTCILSQASSGGRTLTSGGIEEVSTTLRMMTALEKSTVVKAHILKVQDLLAANAVPMET